MTYSWIYLYFQNGKLFEENGDLYCNEVFSSLLEAESYLIDNDLRASII
jgi:hypothetical protein